MTVCAKRSRKSKLRRRARAAPSWQQEVARGLDVTSPHRGESDRARLVAEPDKIEHQATISFPTPPLHPEFVGRGAAVRIVMSGKPRHLYARSSLAPAHCPTQTHGPRRWIPWRT
eukprot:11846754-Alexandrium_andersonii.AAC.1